MRQRQPAFGFLCIDRLIVSLHSAPSNRSMWSVGIFDVGYQTLLRGYYLYQGHLASRPRIKILFSGPYLIFDYITKRYVPSWTGPFDTQFMVSTYYTHQPIRWTKT